MPILLGIIVFGVVILVHEIGHFLAARRFGVLVTEFAIGMGPKIFGIKKGETLYTIRLLPIGGFCLMYGDDADTMAERSEKAKEEVFGDIPDELLAGRSLNSKPIYQRIAIMFGGSFMNFVLAFVLFSIIALVTGTSTTIMRYVGADTPAEESGLMAGDRITHINGSRIFLWDDILFEVRMGHGRPIDVGFVREGQRHDILITPQYITDQHGESRYMIGVSPEARTGLFTQRHEEFARISFGEVITDGFMRIGFVIRTIVITLVRLVTAQLGIDYMAGPIRIVGFIGGQYHATVSAAYEAQASTAALVLSLALSMANLSAFISANLGVMNLLPLPALDGGRIVFLTLEAIRRKPISPEREGMVHLAGFVLLMILAVFIAYQDILSLL